jgi:hypothetical protein
MFHPCQSNRMSCFGFPDTQQREEGKDMVRARLAFLSLASSLLLSSGCASLHHDECHNGGWFSRFRLTSRTAGSHCECEGAMPAGADTTVIPPNAFVPPSAYPAAGTFVAPPPTIMTNPPGAAQPPRIIPQAQPVPYTGQ